MDRRQFIRTSVPLGILALSASSLFASTAKGRRIGIVGLDSSHAAAFTKTLYAQRDTDIYLGYQVVAAFPYVETPIATNKERIAKFQEEVERCDVKIVASIAELLATVDYVMVLTNDGNTRLAQVEEVMKAGKPVFIDKPIAASYAQAQQVFALAQRYATPFFSSSSLRFQTDIQALDTSLVRGVDLYTPATTEPSHSLLYWYGIHGVEMLYALMGTGCLQVQCQSSPTDELIVATWKDGRQASLRAITTGAADFGGVVFTEEKLINLQKFQGYTNLLAAIVQFFETNIVPFDAAQTLEICRFMDAVAASKKRKGKLIKL